MVNFNEIFQVFGNSLSDVNSYLSSYIPGIISAIIIVFVGWVVGVVLGRVIEQIIKSVKIIDSTINSIGLGQIINRAGMQVNVGKFIGTIVELFVIIVFLVAAFDVVGLDNVNQYLVGTVLGYIPNVIAASIIIVATAIISNFVYNIIIGSTRATGIETVGGRIAATISQIAVWVFGVIASLQQLQIAPEFFQVILQGIVIAIAIAIGLAFGFGGQQAAGEFIDNLKKKIK